MKRLKSIQCIVLALLGSVALAGCSSSSWRIQLKDGREYAASSEPQYQAKTGYYRYRNTHGKDALLRAEEVLMVERL